NQGALAESHAVHAIDLPGHGASGKELSDGSATALAEIVTAYMETAGLSAAHLVGHSLGGAIAVQIALDSPSLVAGLTLVAPAGIGEGIAGDFIAGYLSQSRGRKLRPFLEMLVEDPGLVTADMVEDVLKSKRLDGALAALQTIAGANFSGDAQTVAIRDRLSEIDVPVQVIWGAGDRILPASHAEGLADAIRVDVIRDAGHIVHMEKAGAVTLGSGRRLGSGPDLLPM
ncbi:MAG: alpha/beta fold hydrolase, partial [Alphaproteobacteria bacterium]